MAKQSIIQIMMSENLYGNLTRILNKNNLTIEKGLNMFLKWCVAYPEISAKWLEENKKLAENYDESITVLELD